MIGLHDYTQLNRDTEKYINDAIKRLLPIAKSNALKVYYGVEDETNESSVSYNCADLLNLNFNYNGHFVGADYFSFTGFSPKSITGYTWYYDPHKNKNPDFINEQFINRLNYNFAVALYLRYLILKDVETNYKTVQPIKHLIYDFDKKECLDCCYYSLIPNDNLSFLDCCFIEALIVVIMFNERISWEYTYARRFDYNDNPESHVNLISSYNDEDLMFMLYESMVFNSYFQLLPSFATVLIRIALVMTITRKINDNEYLLKITRLKHIIIILSLKDINNSTKLLNNKDFERGGVCGLYAMLSNYLINKASVINNKFAWLFNKIYDYAHMIFKNKDLLECDNASSLCTAIIPCITSIYDNMFNSYYLSIKDYIEDCQYMDLYTNARSFSNVYNINEYKEKRYLDGFRIKLDTTTEFDYDNVCNRYYLAKSWGVKLYEMFENYNFDDFDNFDNLTLDFKYYKAKNLSGEAVSTETAKIYKLESDGSHGVKFNKLKSINLKNTIKSIIDGSLSIEKLEDYVNEALVKEKLMSPAIELDDDNESLLNSKIIIEYIVAFTIYELLCAHNKDYFDNTMPELLVNELDEHELELRIKTARSNIDDATLKSDHKKLLKLSLDLLKYMTFESSIIDFCVFIHYFLGKRKTNYNIYYITDVNSGRLISTTPLHIASGSYHPNLGYRYTFMELCYPFCVSNNSVLEFEPLYELCKHVNPKEIRRYMLYKNKLKGGNNSANSDIKNIILLIFMLLLITIFIISIVVVIIMKLNDNANNYTLKTF